MLFTIGTIYKIAPDYSVYVARGGKDPKILQRFQDISSLPEKDKESLLTTVDYFIKASKISMM